MPDLNVTLPGAGGKDGGQHGVEGGANTGLCVPVQRPRSAGSAEAVQQDPAVCAARHQQLSIWGTLAAHRVAFYLQRVTGGERATPGPQHTCSSRACEAGVIMPTLQRGGPGAELGGAELGERNWVSHPAPRGRAPAPPEAGVLLWTAPRLVSSVESRWNGSPSHQVPGPLHLSDADLSGDRGQS